MADADLFENLPTDPEQAFLLLEREFRRECQEGLRNAHEDENTNLYFVDYIAQVLAAITELGLQAEFDNRVPKIEEVDYQTYLNFNKDVKHFRTMLEIRHGRRVQGYSVQLNTATKLVMQHHIQQLRDIFQKVEIEEDKREALLRRLNELQDEIDRSRTRFDVYAALAIEAGGVVGEVVEKSKILKVLDGIARVLWDSKKEEETKRLPPPTPPKQLEPPKALRPASKHRDMDDEIPF